MALDKAMSDNSGDSCARGQKQADIIIQLTDAADLFHTPDGIGYADIQINGHRETWPNRSKSFKRWIASRFYEKTESAPNSEAFQSAMNMIKARAYFDGPEQKIFVRVGGFNDRIYLDLADDDWQVVEISHDGWRIVTDPPVRFRRSAGMKPLPIPQKGGSVELLRTYLNLQNPEDFVLIVSWALAVLRDCGRTRS